MKRKNYDFVILGAGIYGTYITRKLALKNPDKKIILLEYDAKPFQRASYINQARVHNGYHYPRSLYTALKSASYYNRFLEDYDFAINRKFEKIYAVSKDFSYASGENFSDFCKAASIPCTKIQASKYFKNNMVDDAFLTEEYSLDAKKICAYFISEIDKLNNVDVLYNVRLKDVKSLSDHYKVNIGDELEICADFVMNTSYASINQILNLFGFEKFDVKYEIAELCLGHVTENILEAGLTVMDGPFFSVMPFGLSGYHSLSAVHFTPHKTSYEELPNFNCMEHNPECSPAMLANCNLCENRPQTAWLEMRQLMKKYLNDDIDMVYHKSLFAIKPILKISETSDSRPTVIKEFSNEPTFISVLSGKFNTMYDLDEVLKW